MKNQHYHHRPNSSSTQKPTLSSTSYLNHPPSSPLFFFFDQPSSGFSHLGHPDTWSISGQRILRPVISPDLAGFRTRPVRFAATIMIVGCHPRSGPGRATQTQIGRRWFDQSLLATGIFDSPTSSRHGPPLHGVVDFLFAASGHSIYWSRSR